jgi:NADPH2:quinone reductase
VVLEIRYAALNPADRHLAEGQYPARPPRPHILGRDGLGVIRQIGAGVNGFGVGQTVALLCGAVGVERAGTLAHFTAIPAESLIEVPSGWTEQQAAAAPLTYITAYQALTQWGALPPSVVLITGISGGVGVAAMQLAKALGHTVVGLSRQPDKFPKIKSLGATAVFDSNDTQWRRQLQQALGQRRVDLVVDMIGGAQFNDVLATLGMWGKISTVGRTAGPVPQFNSASLFFRRLRVGGVACSTYSNEQSHASWKHIVELLAKTSAKPVVDQVFAFEELPAAFARLKAGPMGKVLVQIQ